MRLAEEAALHWGGRPVALIVERENAVYRMAVPGGGGGGVAALRLHRMGYQTAAAIRSELWFCGALADAGLPVPRPLLAGDQALVTLSNGRFASAVEWLGGAPLGAAGVPLAGSVARQAEQHFALGQMLARVHTATESLTLPDHFARPAWDVDGLTGDAPFWGRFWEHPALTDAEAGVMRDARGFLRTALQDHARTAPLMPVHADVLRENILVDGSDLSLIDFDDCGMGFALYDLGTVLSQNLYEPGVADLRAGLIAGYGSLRGVEARMVDVFTLARTLASVGWTMPRLAADDPIMRSHIARAVMCARAVME
ncbi:Ser/Thr protein kinase RdoA involved in Cpx stress response, MazF antagonist [Pseudorhodobacter antarcticus]|jgi:Ser/Thr protein kinase RdoA (MazF antagonist)|uniref:Ser/Thr protein kinase RdoA involved in Cpx stress response, MazF antagonist n=1 Tax=Pseudorhodobacter antarcticus TaxID=1077947 RepID=A0A1H8E4N5_9RHOB|nr:phosphotransferase [Pseudorhodobacter antarcticus]SEN14541.1 Ser/Thr protein kinase RdoA involved in Cpx stress response, MazF antagonist [Pseudorhodobacter antarcticus]